MSTVKKSNYYDADAEQQLIDGIGGGSLVKTARRLRLSYTMWVVQRYRKHWSMGHLALLHLAIRDNLGSEGWCKVLPSVPYETPPKEGDAQCQRDQ